MEKEEKIILDFTYMKDMSGIEAWKHSLSPADFTLYITDDPIKAKSAKEEGMAVLISLHDKNRECDFSGFRYFAEDIEQTDLGYLEYIYMREMGLPITIKETKRLRIREMTPEDVDALYSLYEDKSVTAFMEDLPQNREEEKEYIIQYIDTMYGLWGFGMWLVELKDTQEIIGRVGFQNMEDEEKVELGFMIIPKYQGRGYAYESCKAAIAYMKEEFPSYIRMARCDVRNKKAVALCEKLGIKWEPFEEK